MKFFKYLVVSLLIGTAFFSFSSCKKNSDNINHPLEGKWVGSYGFGNETPHAFFSFNIKPGGVIEELSQSGESKGDGTWSINGTTFSATYQWDAPLNTIYSVVAVYDASKGKLTGSWGYNSSSTNGGFWEQSRQ